MIKCSYGSKKRSTRKRSGPRTISWGTPWVIEVIEQKWFAYDKCCSVPLIWPLLSLFSSSISAVSWSFSGEYVVSVDKSRLAVLWSDIWNSQSTKRSCCHSNTPHYTPHLKKQTGLRSVKGNICVFLSCLLIGQKGLKTFCSLPFFICIL